MLDKFKGFDKINESVYNLFERDIEVKKKYSQQVWDMLQKAYESQDGIKGNGFKDIEDMLNIPFWKLNIINEEVLTVFMYKFKKETEDDGYLRKLVALAINNNQKDIARVKMKNTMRLEFSRSILEVSGLLHSYMIRNFPIECGQYAITTDEVVLILPNDNIKTIDGYKYERKIGGEYHEKMMYGTKKKRY